MEQGQPPGSPAGQNWVVEEDMGHMKSQYSVEAHSRDGMTLDELQDAIHRAKAIGVAGDSVVRVENYMVFDWGTLGMPCSKVHFEVPEIKITKLPPRAG